MKLIHYTANTKLKLNSICYLQPKFDYSFKPSGFWFSVEQIEGVSEDSNVNWHEWCTEEGFRLETLKYSYEIKLKSSANILHLKNSQEILDFTEIYKISLFNSVRIHCIEWQKVVKIYDGIIIAPYNWNLRFHPNCFWYYGWDCSSGCIWNLDVVEEIVQLNSTAVAEN